MRSKPTSQENQMEIMLDLETMGNSPTAAIAAIGAVEINLKENTLGRKFYTTVDLESSVAAGGTMDVSTVQWWMKQSDQAREDVLKGGIGVEYALRSFRMWVTSSALVEDVKMWGNGAAFDNVILRGAFERMDIPAPWMFWNDRCFRTFKAISPPVNIPNAGTAHNALDDAAWQAKYLLEGSKCINCF